MSENRYRILLALMGLEIGGAETHVVELAKELQKHGFYIVVASNGGVFEKELLESGIKHYWVPLHNKKVSNIFKSYRLLEKIICDEKIDLVHAHARIPAFILGFLQKKLGFPFVTTAHWVFKTGWGLKYITNWGQKTIAVSEDIKQYLVKNYHIDDKNIKVTINGIDTQKFSSDIDCSDIIKEFDLKGETRVVYISRMDSDRSQVAFQLAEIVPLLADEIPGLEVIIVGGGDTYAKLSEKVQEINKALGRRVIIATGARTDINKFVALADLFVGVSRAVLEAMAAERPVIVAGNEGYIGIFDEQKFPIAITSNFTCRGSEAPTCEALKRDILKVIKEMSAEDKKALGSLGKRTIEERYSVTKMAQDNIEVYLEVLEKK